jgi:hypothetical protein
MPKKSSLANRSSNWVQVSRKVAPPKNGKPWKVQLGDTAPGLDPRRIEHFVVDKEKEIHDGYGLHWTANAKL